MSRFFYSNDRRDATGAIPVYMVATPPAGPPWPNKQNNGGIPVNFVPVGTEAASGPIPVRIVAGTGPGPTWPSDQGQDAGAIPVFNSPAGMPVWDATGTPPLPPPVITSLSFTNPLPIADIDLIGICTADNGPIEWSLGANATPLNLVLGRLNGQLVITNGLIVTPGTYNVTIIATNSSAFDAEGIDIIYTP
jgi:hypothetical protein